MAKLVLLGLLTSALTFGQDCFPLDQKLSFHGGLLSVDENGYRHWIGLRLANPICVKGDRGDGYIEKIDDIKWLQTFVPDQGAIAALLGRLAGNNVLLTGTLTEWHTGYQRAGAVLKVQAVEPVDESGKAALNKPEAPKPIAKDVAAYDVTIRTDQAARQGSTRIRNGATAHASRRIRPPLYDGCGRSDVDELS